MRERIRNGFTSDLPTFCEINAIISHIERQEFPDSLQEDDSDFRDRYSSCDSVDAQDSDLIHDEVDTDQMHVIEDKDPGVEDDGLEIGDPFSGIEDQGSPVRGIDDQVRGEKDPSGGKENGIENNMQDVILGQEGSHTECHTSQDDNICPEVNKPKRVKYLVTSYAGRKRELLNKLIILVPKPYIVHPMSEVAIVRGATQYIKCLQNALQKSVSLSPSPDHCPESHELPYQNGNFSPNACPNPSQSDNQTVQEDRAPSDQCPKLQQVQNQAGDLLSVSIPSGGYNPASDSWMVESCNRNEIPVSYLHGNGLCCYQPLDNFDVTNDFTSIKHSCVRPNCTSTLPTFSQVFAKYAYAFNFSEGHSVNTPCYHKASNYTGVTQNAHCVGNERYGYYSKAASHGTACCNVTSSCQRDPPYANSKSFAYDYPVLTSILTNNDTQKRILGRRKKVKKKRTYRARRSSFNKENRKYTMKSVNEIRDRERVGNRPIDARNMSSNNLLKRCHGQISNKDIACGRNNLGTGTQNLPPDSVAAHDKVFGSAGLLVAHETDDKLNCNPFCLKANGRYEVYGASSRGYACDMSHDNESSVDTLSHDNESSIDTMSHDNDSSVDTMISEITSPLYQNDLQHILSGRHKDGTKEDDKESRVQHETVDSTTGGDNELGKSPIKFRIGINNYSHHAVTCEEMSRVGEVSDLDHSVAGDSDHSDVGHSLDAEELKRPKNGFIRFSVEYRKRLSASHSKMDNREVSRMLGARWRKMTKEEKKPYEEEFQQDIQEIREKHPEWKYGPMKKMYHELIEPMPSRLRPREKLKRKFKPFVKRTMKKQDGTRKRTQQNDTLQIQTHDHQVLGRKQNVSMPCQDCVHQGVPVTSINETQNCCYDYSWVQCSFCLKLRKVPVTSNIRSQSFWFCYMNPDPMYNSCSIEAECQQIHSPESSQCLPQPLYNLDSNDSFARFCTSGHFLYNVPTWSSIKHMY